MDEAKDIMAAIAVDVMGSDSGPAAVVEGLKYALERRSPLEYIAVGNEEVVEPLLRKFGILKDSRVSMFHASEVVSMDEKPMQALKQKKDSSMIRALELVKLGKAQAVVSCGNTGVLMTAGTIKLRTLEGVERPALGSIMPGRDRNFVMIDVGANPDPKPQNLLDNAVLGANYARAILGIAEPKIGLLCNGTEEGKGNSLVQGAHKMLKAAEGTLNYAGRIEGFDVFEGDCDVVVCDGFTGNLLLKTLEGATRMFKGILKEELTRTIFRKIGIWIARKAFDDFKKRIPVEKFSGAPLLGLNGLVVKAHGSSGARQFEGALGIAERCITEQMNRKIAEDFAKISPFIAQTKAQALEG